jgi:cholest-4-en-3-one 26-monooxygenase
MESANIRLANGERGRRKPVSDCPHRRLLDFDAFAQGIPHDHVAELRSEHAVLWEPDEHSPAGHWLVLRQAEIDQVLHTPELFTSSQGPFLEDMPASLIDPSRRSINLMDPPAHRQYRSLVEYAFRPALLKDREPLMRDMAREIIDKVIDRGECEFVNEVAIQLPMRVMFNVLGVRPEDEQRVVALTNAMLFGDDPEFAADKAESFNAKQALDDFGAALAADHRANPRHDITMEVLEAERDGERLSDRDYGAFFTNLIGGGLDTTRNTISWAMVEFIKQPDQYRRLQADPALLPGAVEEIIRFRNPVAYIRRTATKDLELAGQRIPKGGKMTCILGAPNRDPEQFERPDEFDITRDPMDTRRRHRTFGGGPHYCLGMHQARMNLTVMLGEITRRWDNLRLLAAPRHARSIFMDGFNELRLGFDRRAT